MRSIASLEIPSFTIAVLRRYDPSLRHRPIGIISPDAPTRLRVVSEEASADGVRPRMPIDLARRLCPSLRLVTPPPDRIATAQEMVQAVVRRFAPVWEPVHPGHVFLDLTGTQRLLGPSIDTAARIEREIQRDHGLPAVVGLSTNKLVSHAAAGIIGPSHLCEVRPGEEQAFLDPLPVTALDRCLEALSPHTRELLTDLNLRTLGAIAAVPLPHLELVLGRTAVVLHEWSHGIDRSPVLPLLKQPSVEESVTLMPVEVDAHRLRDSVYGLIDRICRVLRARSCGCGRLRLMLRYADQMEVRKRQTVAPPSAWESELYGQATALWERACRRRVAVHQITLAAEALVPIDARPDRQLSLFEDHDVTAGQDRRQRLAQALDHLHSRFGERAIRWARSSACPPPRARRHRP